MSSIILDIVFLAIILLCVIIGIRRGAIKTVLSVVAFLIAVYLAYIIATPFASFLCGKFVEPKIIESVNISISDSSKSIEDALPDFIVKNSDKLGIEIGELNSFNSSSFVKASITPVIVEIASAILMILLFVILAFFLTLTVRIINKLINLSIFGGLNKFLGGIFGAISGVIVVFVLCILLKNAVLLWGNVLSFIDSTTLNGSKIYNLLIGIL